MDSTSTTSLPLHNPLVETASINSRQKRTFILLLIITSFLSLLIVSLFAYYAYVAWSLARPAVMPLSTNPLEAAELSYQDVTFSSITGESELSGWYIPAKSSNTVLFSHGYGGNREEIWVPLYELAKMLHQANYNVLMFDYGYVSNNPKRVMTGGHEEAKELSGAVAYAKSLGAEKVFVWGFSMGAGTALQTALNNQDIDGMILDSTFLLEPDALNRNLQHIIPMPGLISLPLLRLFLPAFAGINLNDIPYEQVKTAAYSIPLFLIHGQKDAKTPYALSETIFRHQTNRRSELWLPPDRGHEMIYRFQSAEYVQRTLRFLTSISPAD